MEDILGLLVIIVLSRVVMLYSRKLVLIKNLSGNDIKDYKKLVKNYYISIFSSIGIMLLYILSLLLGHSIIKPSYLINNTDIALGLIILITTLLVSSYIIRKKQ